MIQEIASKNIENFNPGAESQGTRNVVFDGKPLDTQIILRDSLNAGDRISGPAVIAEYSSTILVPPFATVEVDHLGNLFLEIT
jgi:N-methylhydantoinase A